MADPKYVILEVFINLDSEIQDPYVMRARIEEILKKAYPNNEPAAYVIGPTELLFGKDI
jgi:hypothetical protein